MKLNAFGERGDRLRGRVGHQEDTKSAQRIHLINIGAHRCLGAYELTHRAIRRLEHDAIRTRYRTRLVWAAGDQSHLAQQLTGAQSHRRAVADAQVDLTPEYVKHTR